MEEKLRKSGIDIIGDVPWGTHICQFYETKEDLTEILVPYFKTGLENNEFCLWVTSQPLEIEDAREALRKAVPDLDFYLEKGQIEVISYTDWFVTEGVFDSEKILNGWIEKLNHAFDSSYDGLRLSGNTSWLENKDWNNFIEYKEQTDDVIGNYRMIALCTYSLSRCKVTEIIDVVVNHQFTLIKKEGKWERIESSKRKKAEEAAIQATRNWGYTFDAVPDLIAIIDTEYRIVRANKAMAARLGVTPEDCVGLTCYYVVHGTDEPPSFCPHKQLLNDKTEHMAEVCEDCMGGDFIVSVSPLYDLEGKLTGCIHVARDINERKKAEAALQESEEKYRTIVETANEGICVVDAEARITYVNKKIAEMLGYNREEFFGRFVWDFADDEGKVVLKNSLKKRSLGINENYELRLRCKDGSPLWMLVSSKSLFDKCGKFIGSISMLTDITEKKNTEVKLSETLDNLEELVKARTTELEKAYNSLKESEKSLAEAQKMAHIGNWEWDIATDKAYWSEEIYSIFGRDPQKLAPSYNEYLSYIHSDDRDYYCNAIKKAVHGSPFGIDYRIVLDNGEERTVHLKFEFILNDANTPIRIKGIVQDITERKKAEEKIKMLANSVESSNDAIVTRSLEDIIISWNKGAEKIHGYSAEEILGKHISILEPDNLKGEMKQFSEKIKQGINIQNYETSRLKKDGTIINISVTLSPVFNASGELVAISTIARDITESKREKEETQISEERYRLVTEQTGQLIYDFNFKEDKITWAGAVEEITGYSPEEFKNFDFAMWFEQIHPEDREHVAKTIQKARKKGRKFREEYRLRKKNGYYIYVNVVGTYILDEKGHPYRVIGVVKDITERIEAEEALENIGIARKKEIHHRIKNNLQVISSLLDLQAEKFGNREFIMNSEVLEAFRESQDRVISIALIHEELHEGGGDNTLCFSPYLEKLAENLFHTYRLGSANISLNMDIEENILFDMDIAVPLGMIVNELVSNSLKYAFIGKGIGEIQIKLFSEEAGSELSNGREEPIGNGTRYTLLVSDDGVCIPKKIDIKNSDTLGLQLVNILVDQLDGTIELKRDKGTEFIIKFSTAEK
jgi:PAS domain S-box-containing protein